MNAERLARVRHACGFTLIEALATLLILSIGLLGVAALQLNSLRDNHGSAMRSQATFLAYDVVDRMRANRRAAVAGEYDVALGASGTAGTIAGDDLVAWKQEIAATLPPADIDGDGTLDPADGSVARNGNVFVVTIAWGDARDGDPDAGNALQFAMQTQLSN
jgi:type IV pilus assembly protein PilV